MHDQATTWQFNATVASGDNTLVLQTQDVAGNLSNQTQITIYFDDVAPGAVTITSSDPETGKDMDVQWSAYDELTNGADIQGYEVYISGQAFTNPVQATQLAALSEAQKEYRITGLNAGTNYHVAVVALDNAGNRSPINASLSHYAR